jgi:radical SAM protein with 4Fe4S-binding SPASM domain
MRFLWYTPTEYCRLSPVELEIGAKRCNAGEYSMCIEPDGAVLPCQSYYVAAGNMLCDPWEHIWNSALFRSFRERVDHPAQAGLPEPCHDCPDLPLCAGGCRIEREARAGRKPGDLAHQQRPGVRAAPTAGFVPVAGMVRAAVRARGGSNSMPASSSSDMTEHRMGVSIEQ